MAKYVRYALASVCFAASVGCLALLWRSYYHYDELYRWRLGQYQGVQSWEGRIRLKVPTPGAYSSTPIETLLKRRHRSTYQQSQMLRKLTQAAGPLRQFPEPFGFGFNRDSSGTYIVTIPHWFLLFVSGGLVIASKPPPRRRFSISDSIAFVTVAVLATGTITALLQRLD